MDRLRLDCTLSTKGSVDALRLLRSGTLRALSCFRSGPVLHLNVSMSDDWADDDSPHQQDELAREWDLRREQHYNVSYLHHKSSPALACTESVKTV